MNKFVYMSMLLVVASAMANASNPVPYAETFESYPAGFEMLGTNGWSAAASSNAVVSTAYTPVYDLNAYSEPCGYPVGSAAHDKVLEVSGAVTNSFSMAANQVVWVDMMQEANGLPSADAGLLGAAHAAFYFNHYGHPLVYHRDVTGGTNRWTEISEVTKSGWVRETIGLDYQTGYFQIKMDGVLLTNALAWTSNDGSGSPGGSWFKMPGSPSQLNELVFDGRGRNMDDLLVTMDDPFLPVIESLEHVSGDVYKMAVGFPAGNQMVLPSSFAPIKSTDLVYGSWDDTIPHSTNGVDGWRDASLNYSVDLGSSRIIYLQSNAPVAFFALGEGPPPFTLWQLPSQTSGPTPTQMLSYVIETADSNKVIVIDGGNPVDGPYLKDFLAARGNHVDSWFITHPHVDHVSALTWILGNQGDLVIDNIYASLPSVEWVQTYEPGAVSTLQDFLDALAAAGRSYTDINAGDLLDIDEIHVEVLYAGNASITNNAVNNQSLLMRFTGHTKSILFTGDLGVEAGNDVLATVNHQKLKADYVQAAHHGNNGVDFAFYEAVQPKYCLWPTPLWLWNNDNGGGYDSGPWTTLETRQWMDDLGVISNYVSGVSGLIEIK